MKTHQYTKNTNCIAFNTMSAGKCCKVFPRVSSEGPEVKQRYSSILSLTSALDGGGWLTPRPGRLSPGKQTRYSLCRRLGGPKGRAGRVRKILLSPGFDPRTAQPNAQSVTYFNHFILFKLSTALLTHPRLTVRMALKSHDFETEYFDSS